MTANANDRGPMMEMNMTPLIDVLLVLIIMFIITIPIQTHAVELDLPGNSMPKDAVSQTKNKIVIDPAGIVRWNGAAVDLVTLRQYLDLTKNMSPEPELHLQPDPQARYDMVDKVLAVTKKAQVTKMGFVGNERYSSF